MTCQELDPVLAGSIEILAGHRDSGSVAVVHIVVVVAAAVARTDRRHNHRLEAERMVLNLLEDTDYMVVRDVAAANALEIAEIRAVAGGMALEHQAMAAAAAAAVAVVVEESAAVRSYLKGLSILGFEN